LLERKKRVFDFLERLDHLGPRLIIQGRNPDIIITLKVDFEETALRERL